MAVSQSNDSPTKNFAVLSPLSLQANIVLSEGNLKQVSSSNSQGLSLSSFPVTTGQKVYIEATLTNTGGETGCLKATATTAGDPSKTFDDLTSGDARLLNVNNGDVFTFDGTALVSNYAPNDSNPTTHMIALDLVNDKIYWGDAGVGANGWSNGSGSYNQAFSSAVGVDLDANLDWFFAFKGYNATIAVNFGATAFTASPPDGYSSGYSVALENTNRETALTIEDGSAFFQTIAEWTGNASSQTVTQTGNSGFTPDWAIIKSRSFGNGANSFDSVRGGSKGLATFDSGVEDDQADGVAFSSSSGKGTLAFTGSGDTGDINHTGRTYLAWTWLAGGAPTTDNISNGGSPGQTPTNNSVFRDGAASTTAFGSATIYPTRASINTTCGLSIIEYVGTGSNATLAHGLGAVPKMAWFRNRESAGNNWVVYHSAATGNTHCTFLDLTNAQGAVDRFQDTDPTDAVFSVDGTTDINKSTDEHVAYIFAEIPGFSKFGSFEGNGSTSDGPFIELGFKPAWFMWKNVDSSTNGNWTVMDSGRDPFNMVENNLRMDTAMVQDTGEADLDFLSNGVKHRGGASARFNASATYLYAAFAEHPFAGSTPATAR